MKGTVLAALESDLKVEATHGGEGATERQDRLGIR